MVDYVALCYSLAIVLLVAVAVYACVISYKLRLKTRNTESFITARNQVLTTWSRGWYLSPRPTHPLTHPHPHISTPLPACCFRWARCASGGPSLPAQWARG
jgi:hypothetical protein